MYVISCWGFVSFTSRLLLSVHLPASRLGVSSVFTWWIIDALLQHKCVVCISRVSSSVLLYNKLYALSEAEQHVMTTSSFKAFSYLQESCHWLTVWDDRNMDFQLSKLLLKTFFSHQSKSLCIQLAREFWQREKWEMTARTSSGRESTRWGRPIYCISWPALHHLFLHLCFVPMMHLRGELHEPTRHTQTLYKVTVWFADKWDSSLSAGH